MKFQWGVLMKRIVAAMLLIILLSITAGGSFVQAGVSRGDGKVATGFLKDVKYTGNGSYEAVDITLENYADYSVMKLSSPERIVIDIFNAVAPGKQQIIQTNGNVIKNIRYAQFDTYTARVVLDVSEQLEYGINKTEKGLQLYIGDLPENSEKPEEESPAPVTVNPVAKKLSVHKYFNIEYTPKESSDEVAVVLSSYSKYTVMRLTGPDRLVIDIPNAKYSGKTQKLDINGTQIKSIRYSKYGTNTARIVLDLTWQAQYSVNETKGRLLINVENPSYKNIIYHNNGDRVYFILHKAILTQGDEFLKKFYSGTYDKTGKMYTITFPNSQADLGSGIFKINDDYLTSLEINNDQNTNTTSITFNSPKKQAYLVFTRSNLEDTAITVMKSAAAAEKLVVIDAGHGGTMPGAIYKGVYEKELNLDIAKRLDVLLQKKKIKTFMIREDDTDIANYERSYIANMLGASLFISIHNNAMDDPNYSGTMTLYYPQNSNSKSFNGKTFADIIQQKLVGSLKTVNRKAIERPNLVVLRATVMPSAIAEVAFLTNNTDRANLQKESFRQKAAQALCDAIVKALPNVK
jgi:N-acetylmuramoyl-L-alanine amidase